MNIRQSYLDQLPLEIARQLAETFAQTAAERDKQGENPKAERDLIRQSGLLGLSIPKQYGGQEADWQTIFKTIQVIARVDSSLAHVYGFHHLLIATVQLFSQPEQYGAWFEQTAQNNLFWGNTLNPLDRRTTAIKVSENEYIFHGDKSFCSGSIDSDMLLCSGYNEAGKLLIGVIPTQREGVSFLGDWNNMGQRQTDSGTSHFEQVNIHEDELLLNPGPLSTPYSSLRPLIAQLIDGDLAANNGGWQWCASTGMDAVPYFRIFNPVSQSQKFDPNGDYIRRWVPELGHLDAKSIHEPYAKNPDLELDYPKPIVDLKASRVRAIEAFKQI